MYSRKLLSLAFVGAASLLAFPAAAAQDTCISKNGKLAVTPADGAYCSCVASLTKNQIRKYRIDQNAVDECLLTTGSLDGSATMTPPDSINPPVVPPTPPPDGGFDGKANNGLGNGSDPAPPGIGNAGNDGGDVAAGSVAVTPGSPGGSSTAPGQNK